MKHLAVGLLSMFLISLLYSCNYSNESKTINAENKFSMTLPSWLKEDKKLKPDAEMQYANRFRNFYVIAETVKDASAMPQPLVSNYVRHLCDTSVLKNALVTDSASITVGGLSGVRMEIFGKMDGEVIYFSEVVLEGKKSPYHISIWTRSEERKLRFKNDITAIIESFREI